jgi:hypothetical protein
MLTVHLRVNDASTGRPTPVRLRLLADGSPHAPFGRLLAFACGPGEEVGGQVQIGADAYAYIDGTCEVRLPAGPLTVELSKGPEYLPVHSLLSLRPGQISLRLTIERCTDWRAEGWYGGDVRVHDLSPHAALLEGAAEGLSVVHLLARERPPHAGRPPAISNLLAFSGTSPVLESPECVVAVNTLNEHPMLGRVGLLDSHRPVYPLRFGGPDGQDDWSVSDWCDQCHRKRGLVTWPDLPRLVPEAWQGEALAALLLGKIDAFEVSWLPVDDPWSALATWYRLLDCGYRPALVGASGKDSNSLLIGRVRTYAHLDPGSPFSLPAWNDAVRRGRTFLTSGPLLTLEVAGRPPGEVIQAETGQRLSLRAAVASVAPVDRIEILAGGKVLATGRGPDQPGNRKPVAVEAELVVEESTWIAARCWGKQPMPGGGCAAAHTSAVAVQVAGKPIHPVPATVEPLLTVLDQTAEWVEKQARCEVERQREHLGDVLRTAREELLRRAQR